jgi:hypothetical protein
MNLNHAVCSSTVFCAILSAIAFFPTPVRAQSSVPTSECVNKALSSGDAVARLTALGRAKNLARQAAEAANGGLIYYRTDATFHGTISDAPCVDNGDGTWTFTVKGGEPAFTTPSIETVVLVDGNTWKVKVEYNGPIR